MKTLPFLILCQTISLFRALGSEPLTILETKEAKSEVTGVTIVAGTIDLPRRGFWTAEGTYRDQGGLTELYLRANHHTTTNDGVRSAKLKDRVSIQDRRQKIQRIYWTCRTHAKEGAGLAPDSLEGIEPSHAPKNADPITGLHLIPGVRMLKKEGKEMVRVDDTTPLLIDTTPAIDDGKHWIIDNRGTSTRKDIDSDWLKSLGLTISPQAKSHLVRLGADAPNRTYQIFARRTGDPGKIDFIIRNHSQDTSLKVRWDTSTPAKGGEEIVNQWASIRLGYLHPYLLSDATASPQWVARMDEQYKLDYSYKELFRQDRRNSGRTASAMSMIGGRAAIRETLQLQNIRTNDKGSRVPEIPIHTTR